MKPKIIAFLVAIVALLFILLRYLGGVGSGPDAGPDVGTGGPSFDPQCDVCVYRHDFSGDYSFKTDASNSPTIAYPWTFERLDIVYESGGSLQMIKAIPTTGQDTKIAGGSPFEIKLEAETGDLSEVDPATAQVTMHFTVEGTGGPVAHSTKEVCVNADEGTPCNCAYKDPSDPSAGVHCE